MSMKVMRLDPIQKKAGQYRLLRTKLTKKNVKQKFDFDDPFNVGQMIGMLITLSFIEKNQGISDETLQNVKAKAADNVQNYLNKPTEDVLLMIDDLVEDMFAV